VVPSHWIMQSDLTGYLANLQSQNEQIIKQQELILQKLDGLLSDLNSVQSGTFANYDYEALREIRFSISH
jgi:hypothetical protein